MLAVNDTELKENVHLIGNEENYKWLMESKRQLEEGILQMKALTEMSEAE